MSTPSMHATAEGMPSGGLLLLLLLFIAGVVAVFVRLRRLCGDGSGSAPSPPSLPLLGHLHLLTKPLHRSLAALAGAPEAKAAPILSLRVGARRALLVSAHAAAEECFTTHDSVLAGRPQLLAAEHLGYGRTTVVWASHGDHWRGLRRFLTVELFSSSRLAALAVDRRAEVASLVQNLLHDAAVGPVGITLRPRLFELVLNVMLRAITARPHAGDVHRFQEIVEETFAVSGAPCLGDFFPALRWVDRLRGVEATLANLQTRRDAFVTGLIDDHRRMRDAGGRDVEKKGVIDVLMEHQQTDPEYYTDTVVKGIILVLLTAGTDTSALTTEWAMAQLLTHPEVMRKAKAELDAIVGTGRLVEESDITNLPYLQCVVKETLRLRPVGPVIPAHEATEDCTVGGFRVRRGTMILVNAWAIHRDADVWDAPEEFKPERFLDRDAVTTPMLPFGLGRRRCPGEGLAMRLVPLTLAALLQCFEWDVGEGGTIDMAEGAGLTMPMATPLEAICRPRSSSRVCSLLPPDRLNTNFWRNEEEIGLKLFATEIVVEKNTCSKIPLAATEHCKITGV